MANNDPLEPRQILQQLVDALPEDATLEDFHEFFHERTRIEDARAELEEGRSISSRQVLGEELAGDPELPWAESAVENYRELRTAPIKNFPDLASGLRGALESLGSPGYRDVTLPELGDVTIREIRIRVGWNTVRLVFDLATGAPRILRCTNDTSCYRNVRGISPGPRPAAQ